MPIHDEIRALGWLQGSFFSEANNGRLAELIGAEIPEGSLALVITHTCDLVHPSIRAEPYVELIVATRLIGNPDPGCENCRSTRKLHLPVQYSDGRTGHIELKQAATCRISRELLQELPPSRDVSLSHDEKIKLTSWLALRYMRATFPDNFERRIQNIKSAIRQALFPVSQIVNSIYLGLSEFQELSEDVNYRIMLYFVMDADVFNDDVQRQNAETTLADVRQMLINCPGIEVIEFEVKSTDDVTLEDLKGLALWNLDHVSLATDPITALPASHPH